MAADPEEMTVHVLHFAPSLQARRVDVEALAFWRGVAAQMAREARSCSCAFCGCKGCLARGDKLRAQAREATP